MKRGVEGGGGGEGQVREGSKRGEFSRVDDGYFDL